MLLTEGQTKDRADSKMSFSATGADDLAPSPAAAAKTGEKVKGWDATNWDLDTQQPHGGQEWAGMGDKFVEDFSVTTNFMGPPWRAVAAATASLQHIDHYPAANCEPAVTDLAVWMTPQGESVEDTRARLLLGNGASELIDLVTRIAAPEGGFVQGSSTVQYKEYERAAAAAQPMKSADGEPMKVSKPDLLSEEIEKAALASGIDTDKFAIMAVVNPCNPTGEYLPVEELKQFIEAKAVKDGRQGCCVLVDESMQLWHGEGWREDSLVSQREWVKKMDAEFGVQVFIIHSWTKIWSCPGVRLGSVLTPTVEHAAKLKAHQVPWSLNVAALAFLSAAVADEEFLRRTWDLTPRWRARTVDELKKIPAFSKWQFLGAPWTSWLWVDTKDAAQVEQVVKVAKAAGCPVRNGAMGYSMPTFVRFAVRAPNKQDILVGALKQAFGSADPQAMGA